MSGAGLRCWEFEASGYLEGHGDLVSRLMIRITRVIIEVIGILNTRTKSP